MTEYQKKIKTIIDNIEKTFLGKRDVITMLMIACLARGHVLIEDVPGIGKTSLAKALAMSFDSSFKRIQFTPDTTPSDVVGFSMYDTKANEFKYIEGAVLNNIVLADELNRTSPKTQSALLEAMQEGKVTVDGQTHDIPEPFMLIATQNQAEQFGTYPLPESQLDRFMMVMSIGYPDEDSSVNIVDGASLRPEIETVASNDTLKGLQDAADKVFMDKKLSQYIVKIAIATRESRFIQTGISIRGTLLMARAAKARALIEGRDFVTPDDIKYLLHPVFDHRLALNREGTTMYATPTELMKDIIRYIRVPELGK
ncbi:MAG: MoxR family ATPase [Clostridia bacterium]|nr:MoxR family ATPase [Clostridia bacterium]